MIKKVCYYVSGHGLGHASRATQIMQALSPEIPLIVKTAAPEEFIRREAKRDLEYIRQQFDTGTWQASNVEIDWNRTVSEALRVQEEAEVQLKAEAQFLRGENVGLVVSDIPPLPLAAAASAGVPSLAIANFTWIEIFRAAARRDSRVRWLVEEYRRQYASATLALRAGLNFPMTYFPVLNDIPLIARRGTASRKALLAHLGSEQSSKLVLLYFGAWGNSELRLDLIDRLTGYTFLAFTPMPSPIHTLNPSQWSFPDVVASADVVLAKPGYGTLGECMANGTPVVYYPRPEFAEYPILRTALRNWGGAVQISRPDFLACRWKDSLEEAIRLAPSRVDAAGARVAAEEITAMLCQHR